MDYRYNSSPVTEKFVELVKDQLASIVDRSNAQTSALLLAEQLPRNNVRVVLHRGDENFIPGGDISAAISRRDQVDRLGCATSEDDLARLSRVYEGLRLDPRLFVFVSRALAEIMHASVNIRVIAFVVTRRSIYHGLRLLAGRRIIKINQWLSVDSLLQYREVFSDSIDVEGS